MLKNFGFQKEACWWIFSDKMLSGKKVWEIRGENCTRDRIGALVAGTAVSAFSFLGTFPIFWRCVIFSQICFPFSPKSNQVLY